jgi:hypothetical protein
MSTRFLYTVMMYIAVSYRLSAYSLKAPDIEMLGFSSECYACRLG